MIINQGSEPNLVRVLRLADAVTGAAAFAWVAHQYQVPLKDTLIMGIVIFFSVSIFHSLNGVYKTWQYYVFRREQMLVLFSNAMLAGILLIYAYFIRPIVPLPLRLVLWWSIVNFLVNATVRFCLYVALIVNQRRGIVSRKAVLCGISNAGVQLIKWLTYNPWSATDLIGVFSDNQSVQSLYGIPVIGSPDDLPAYIHTHQIDTVYLAFSSYDEKYVQDLLEKLIDSTCSIEFATDISTLSYFHKLGVKYFGGLPVMSVVGSPLSGFTRFLKRVEDILLSAFFIILSAPVMLVSALLIKLTMPGSVIFKQWRYGYRGRPFQVWKFRTMKVSEDGYAFQQATEDDPRITRVGKLLRKTSIDELPQFFNVFWGEMSIVGPRPHAVSMVDEYRTAVSGSMLRHLIKPGITGLAQLQGTREAIASIHQIHERILYDIDYIRKWSLALDLKIIMKTAISILFGKKRIV